ncbi:MAG: hypothetical protein AAGF56_06395 [Pseudomonadota bacterium]
MLLLEVFPLSFAILWRFLLIFPLWLILYVALTVMSLLFGLLVLGNIPIIGLLALIVVPLILIAITYVIAMHPYLVGIHIGLRVLGAEPTKEQTGLLRAAVGYGLVEAVIAYVFTLIGLVFAVLLLRTDAVVITDLAAQRTPDPTAALASQLAAGTLTVLSATGAVVSFLVRAALLPVLASAAAGRNPNGARHQAFDGFGAMLPMMIALMLMILAVQAVAIPVLVDASAYIGLSQLLTEQLDDVVLFVLGEEEFTFTLAHALLVATAVLLSIWLFCLQCAGAALAHVKRAPVKPTPVGRAELAADIAALRRARMPRGDEARSLR